MLRSCFFYAELEKHTKTTQLFTRSNEPHSVCSTEREREREREIKMGLFDALPPLASASLKAKVNVKEEDDETRHTEKKRKFDDDDDEEEEKLFESTITKVSFRERRAISITIKDGDAVWRMANPPRNMLRPKVGDTVVFKKASLGTYFIRINGRLGIKGKRVE